MAAACPGADQSTSATTRGLFLKRRLPLAGWSPRGHSLPQLDFSIHSWRHLFPTRICVGSPLRDLHNRHQPQVSEAPCISFPLLLLGGMKENTPLPYPGPETAVGSAYCRSQAPRGKTPWPRNSKSGPGAINSYMRRSTPPHCRIEDKRQPPKKRCHISTLLQTFKPLDGAVFGLLGICDRYAKWRGRQIDLAGQPQQKNTNGKKGERKLRRGREGGFRGRCGKRMRREACKAQPCLGR